MKFFFISPLSFSLYLYCSPYYNYIHKYIIMYIMIYFLLLHSLISNHPLTVSLVHSLSRKLHYRWSSFLAQHSLILIMNDVTGIILRNVFTFSSPHGSHIPKNLKMRKRTHTHTHMFLSLRISLVLPFGQTQNLKLFLNTLQIASSPTDISVF